MSTAPVWSTAQPWLRPRVRRLSENYGRMALADDGAAELEDSQVQVAAAFVAGTQAAELSLHPRGVERVQSGGERRMKE